MKSGTGILPVGFGGIGILPMIHGLEAHATRSPVFIRVLSQAARLRSLAAALRRPPSIFTASCQNGTANVTNPRCPGRDVSRPESP